jgi:hypothetical protein
LDTNELTWKSWVHIAVAHYFPSKEDRAEAKHHSQGIWADGAYRAYIHNAEHGTETNELGGVILNAWDALTYPLTLLICLLWGHDIVDDSHGGPDSGTMGIRCRRCGYSHSVQMY